MAYLDHAATTPMLPEAVAAMTASLTALGNPSSLHAAGRRARRLVEESRETLAQALDARPSEVVFTGGGTEADNLAVKGVYWARRDQDARRRRVVVGATEHHAVLDAAAWLAAHQGAVVTTVAVDRTGRVTPDALEAALGPDPSDVAMVSVMWANNEVGTVADIPALVSVARAAGVPIHSDAVQAVGQLPVSFAASGLDAMTVTGHKCGGPVGAGALLLGREVPCTPLLHGGGQEREIRSGTLDAAGVAGLAAAVATSGAGREDRVRRVAALRAEIVGAVLTAVPDAELNGDPDLAGGGRLPGNAHFSFPGCEGDALLMLLDARGIECSTGSACSAGVAQASHVLLAMGLGSARARGSLRFSLGHTSRRSDVVALAGAIGPVVDRARRAGSAGVLATTGDHIRPPARPVAGDAMTAGMAATGPRPD